MAYPPHCNYGILIAEMLDVNESIFPPITSANKRVVLQHASGLTQILGTTDGLMESFNVASLPAMLPEVDLGTHVNGCSLIRVTPRYVLYREFMPELVGLKAFNPAQR